MTREELAAWIELNLQAAREDERSDDPLAVGLRLLGAAHDLRGMQDAEADLRAYALYSYLAVELEVIAHRHLRAVRDDLLELLELPPAPGDDSGGP